jgi:hypothetical protein
LSILPLPTPTIPQIDRRRVQYRNQRLPATAKLNKMNREGLKHRLMTLEPVRL